MQRDDVRELQECFRHTELRSADTLVADAGDIVPVPSDRSVAAPVGFLVLEDVEAGLRAVDLVPNERSRRDLSQQGATRGALPIRERRSKRDLFHRLL